MHILANAFASNITHTVWAVIRSNQDDQGMIIWNTMNGNMISKYIKEKTL